MSCEGVQKWGGGAMWNTVSNNPANVQTAKANEELVRVLQRNKAEGKGDVAEYAEGALKAMGL